MCTVSIIPLGRRGYRLACNRDESRRRRTAVAPRQVTVPVRFGGTIRQGRAIHPMDPDSGGTWIAVNDRGLTLVVLNRNDAPACEHCGGAGDFASPLSRGTIIPALLAAGSAKQAARRALALDHEAMAPFRLVVIDRRAVIEVTSDGQVLTRRDLGAPRKPVMFTSSGLGDARVEGPRRTLFARLMRLGPADASAQDAFHRHRWPRRPHLSVRMARTEARTVSLTTVTVTTGEAVMSYHRHGPLGAASRHVLALTGPKRRASCQR